MEVQELVHNTRVILIDEVIWDSSNLGKWDEPIVWILLRVFFQCKLEKFNTLFISSLSCKVYIYHLQVSSVGQMMDKWKYNIQLWKWTTLKAFCSFHRLTCLFERMYTVRMYSLPQLLVRRQREKKKNIFVKIDLCSHKCF